MLFDFHDETNGPTVINFVYDPESDMTHPVYRFGWGPDADWFQENPAACSWTGITCVEEDGQEHVSELALPSSALTLPLSGTLPSNLDELSMLTRLEVDGNEPLVGELPLSLTDSNIEELSYTETGLCVPGDADLMTWLANLVQHDGTGTDCDVTPTAVSLQSMAPSVSQSMLLFVLALIFLSIVATIKNWAQYIAPLPNDHEHKKES